MKKYTVLFYALIFFIAANAQQTSLVLDKEDLFTETEEKRIDSLLQAYHQKSGNLMALYTDSADISEKDFGYRVYSLFKKPGSDNAYSYILMMSRNHSFLITTVNKITASQVNQQQLEALMEKGFASFKEKKREEGVVKIFEEAMEFLDTIPKH